MTDSTPASVPTGKQADPPALAADSWAILVVQGRNPSERFIGPFTRADAEAWIGLQVEKGATWSRLVLAPLEAPSAT